MLPHGKTTKDPSSCFWKGSGSCKMSGRHTCPQRPMKIRHDSKFSRFLFANLAFSAPVAPRNNAFAVLDNDDPILTAIILQNKVFLRGFLGYHIVPGKISSTNVTSVDFYPTLSGEHLVLQPNLGLINGNVTSMELDMEAANGIIHSIDDVLTPESIQDMMRLKGDFQSFLALIDNAGLDYSGQNGDSSTISTIFAPTDHSLSGLLMDWPWDPLAPQNAYLARTLVQHLVVRGSRTANKFRDGQVMLDSKGYNRTFAQEPFAFNGINVTRQDIVGLNGALHIMDEPLAFPSDYWTHNNIVERLESEGEYSTLLTLLNVTGVNEILMDKGPLTLFAPTDRAFVRLFAQETLRNLTDPDNVDLLREVLLCHVLENITASADIKSFYNRTTLPTLLPGGNLTVDPTNSWPLLNGDVRLNPRKLDLLAWNGIVHQVLDVIISTTVNITRPEFNETFSPTAMPVAPEPSSTAPITGGGIPTNGAPSTGTTPSATITSDGSLALVGGLPWLLGVFFLLREIL